MKTERVGARLTWSLYVTLVTSDARNTRRSGVSGGASTSLPPTDVASLWAPTRGGGNGSSGTRLPNLEDRYSLKTRLRVYTASSTMHVTSAPDTASTQGTPAVAHLGFLLGFSEQAVTLLGFSLPGFTPLGDWML